MQEIVNGLIKKHFPISIAENGYILWGGNYKCDYNRPNHVKEYMYTINELTLKKGRKISDDDQKLIDMYIKNGFPIAMGQDGLYIWDGKPICENLKKIRCGKMDVYTFD